MSEQQFKPAWRGFYLHFLAIIVLLAAAAVVSATAAWLTPNYQQWLWRVTAAIVVYIACHMAYKRSGVTLTVRPDKISMESGLIGRQSVEIGMRSVRSIQVNQSVMQRILNVGDIMVASSGTDGYEITAVNMPSPHEIRESMHITERLGSEEEQEKGESKA